MKTRRVLCILICSAIVLTVVFCAAFIGAFAVHDCHGENCVICFEIKVCVSMLRLTAALVSAALIAFILNLITHLKSGFSSEQACSVSLITLKVKLSS